MCDVGQRPDPSVPSFWCSIALSQSGTCRTVQTRAQRLTSWSRNVRLDLPMRTTPLLPLSTRRVHVLGFHHALSLPYSHAFQCEQTHTGRAWPSKSDMVPCDHGSSPVAATLSSKTQCLLHGLSDRVSLGTFRFHVFVSVQLVRQGFFQGTLTAQKVCSGMKPGCNKTDLWVGKQRHILTGQHPVPRQLTERKWRSLMPKNAELKGKPEGSEMTPHTDAVSGSSQSPLDDNYF